MASYAERVLRQVKKNNPGEPEFHQAVAEVLESLKSSLTTTPSTKERVFSNVSSNPNAC